MSCCGTSRLTRVAAELDRAEQSEAELLLLLKDGHDIYTGLSTDEAERVRAVIFARLPQSISDQARHLILAEIETGHHAFAVAAATAALRRVRNTPKDALAIVVEAKERLRLANAYVWDDALSLEGPAETTLLDELELTIAFLTTARVDTKAVGSTVSACRGGGKAPARSATFPGAVMLQDQSGAEIRFSDFFTGAPSAVAFFYTRCDNPQKCSLTVSKLAQVQKRLSHAPVRLAAITYDPAYDLPARLAVYGRERGIEFGPDVRFFRATDGMRSISDYFELGVSYGDVTVNRHRSELTVLSAAADIVGVYEGRLWNVDDVAERLIGALASA